MMLLKKLIMINCLQKLIIFDTSGFFLKTKYDTDKSELENKIPNTGGLVKKTDYNSKITEIESKIPGVNNLVAKTALTNVENKIPDVTNLATTAELTVVENKIHDDSILAKKTNYNARVAKIDNKVSSLDGKIVENKTKMCLLKMH